MKKLVLLLLFSIPLDLLSQARVGVFYTPGLNVTRFRSKKEHLSGPRNNINFSSEIGLNIDLPFGRYAFSPTLSFIARKNSVLIREGGSLKKREVHTLQYASITLPLRLTTEEYDIAGLTGVRFLFIIGPRLLLKVYHFPEDNEIEPVVERFSIGDVAIHNMAGVEIPLGLETKLVVGPTYTVGLVELAREGPYDREEISLRNTNWGFSVGIVF